MFLTNKGGNNVFVDSFDSLNLIIHISNEWGLKIYLEGASVGNGERFERWLATLRKPSELIYRLILIIIFLERCDERSNEK